jgi:hypothetical protein
LNSDSISICRPYNYRFHHVHITRHTSHVTRHTSHVTRHVTRPTSQGGCSTMRGDV